MQPRNLEMELLFLKDLLLLNTEWKVKSKFCDCSLVLVINKFVHLVCCGKTRHIFSLLLNSNVPVPALCLRSRLSWQQRRTVCVRTHLAVSEGDFPFPGVCVTQCWAGLCFYRVESNGTQIKRLAMAAKLWSGGYPLRKMCSLSKHRVTHPR